MSSKVWWYKVERMMDNGGIGINPYWMVSGDRTRKAVGLTLCKECVINHVIYYTFLTKCQPDRLPSSVTRYHPVRINANTSIIHHSFNLIPSYFWTHLRFILDFQSRIPLLVSNLTHITHIIHNLTHISHNLTWSFFF